MAIAGAREPNQEMILKNSCNRFPIVDPGVREIVSVSIPLLSTVSGGRLASFTKTSEGVPEDRLTAVQA